MDRAASLETENDGEEKSIRGYRARKLRPCDNCRSRRKRCLIPEVGHPCSLCVRSGKQCTFLYGRRSSKPAPSSVAKPSVSMEASSSKQEIPSLGNAFASLPQTSPVDLRLAAPSQERNFTNSTVQPLYHSSTTVISPFNETSASVVLPWVSNPTHELISSVRRARQAAPSRAALALDLRFNQSYLALDDEAADDEELYLVGTASERDALVLNTMAGDEENESQASGQNRSAIPGLRIRKVSPNVSFVFYKSQPYGPEGREENAYSALEALVTSHLADSIVQRFFNIEGQGLPIWSSHSRADRSSASALRCLCLTAGLIYTPSLRHLHHEAYIITMKDFRRQSPRARLWTMQFYLTDLDGRESINPSGNFLTLGLAGSTARLLGLHEDCSTWSIPQWEKDLRSRLWWALLVYDKLSSLTFGRPRTIQAQKTTSLPSLGPNPTTSLDAFISLCELVNILDDLQPSSSASSPCACEIHNPDPLDRLSEVAYRLDQWKSERDARSLFVRPLGPDAESAPGVCSLNLAYLGAVLMVVREAWDGVANEDPSVQIASQRSCLKSCEDIVEFLCSLTKNDRRGYWSSHSPFFLSFCLTLLTRLIMNSDRTDQSDNAIWQAALFALRRLISTMSRYRTEDQWDVAQLALSRARYFIPLLARQASEFQVALLPLENALVDIPTDESLDQFWKSIIDMSGLENLFNFQPEVPDLLPDMGVLT